MAFTGETKGFINYIYERYSHLRIKDISLVFEGQITHQVINRHAESYEYRGHPYPGTGLVLVAKNKERFQVTTGNIVETGHVDEIAMFLGKLNNMDADTLDEHYKKQMREGIMSPKGGAGLGFIDIRRKTGNPLDYSFVKIDEETSFFIFTSTITR